MARSSYKEATVRIQSFSKDGHGLGQVDLPDGGQCEIEIPFTMPGDLVRSSYRRKRKGRYQGRIEELVEASPQRTTPRCEHFGLCGGCRWQHLSYEEQLRLKEERVRELFGKDVRPIIACDSAWAYRNKMEFSFSRDRKGQFFAGLYQGRGRVFNMQSCHLVSSWFAEALQATSAWAEANEILAYHPDSDSGALRTLIVREARSSGDRLLMLTVSGRPEFALTAPQTQDWVDAMQAFAPDSGKLSIFLRVQQIQKGQPTQFFEMHLAGPEHIREELRIEGPSGQTHTLDFEISPSAFFQPNSAQAERLYSTALSMAVIDKDSTAFDLYCGTGTLGICLAKELDHVLGIELSQEASLDARENAARNGIENYHVISGDVGKILTARRKQPDFKAPNLVVVDPPRAGLDPTAIQHLCDLKAQQILYISCNPVTQAANVEELCNAGYVIKAIQPLDQTPHTVHIENIVLLERSP